MSHLAGYTDSIISACILFLPVAALFTLPFMVFQYRRYGSIPALRVLIIYSFILYMMCAFLLTVLPLPDISKADAMKPKSIQYIPFSTYVDAMRNAGMHLSKPKAFIDPKVWLTLLRSGGFFEILANIVMQIPLGIYLRYYFQKNRRQALIIGLCVSLFYELTQLSGLFFIYPKAYRLCSVDDLIDNTLGCMIGFWVTPLLAKILPTREELDLYSVSHDRKATVMRRVTAAFVDWAIYLSLFVIPVLLHGSDARSFFIIQSIAYPVWIFGYFMIFQRFFHGKTLGKLLLRIRVIDRDKIRAPGFSQFVLRYTIIYLAAPVCIAVVALLMIILIAAIGSEFEIFYFLGIIGMFLTVVLLAWGILHILTHRNELPHSYLSRTRIMTVARSNRAEAIYQRAKQMHTRLMGHRKQRRLP